MTAPTTNGRGGGDLDARARHAAAAVRRRAAELPDDRLEAVVRKAERPRAPQGLALLLLVVAVAVGIRVLPAGDPDVELGGQPPAEETASEPTQPEEAPTGEPSWEPTDPSDNGKPADIAPSPDASDAVTPLEPTAPETEPAAQPTQEPAAPVTPLGRFSTEPVVGNGFPAATTEIAYLTDVRVGSHPGFDRIVLELDGPMPGYSVALVEPQMIAGPSGEPTDLEGEAFLQILLQPASGVRQDDSPQGYTEVYTGPRRLRAATVNVTEVVHVADFEASLSWGVGLRSATGYSVTELSGPTRLVIDIAHPTG